MASVIVELVVSVFSREPIAPWRSGRSRSNDRGSSGASAARSTAMNKRARMSTTPSKAAPAGALPFSGSSVVAMTNPMTAAVNSSELASGSATGRSACRSRGIARRIPAARITATGRYPQKISRQPASSVTTPPITKPLAPAAAPAALHAATARRRCRPSSLIVVSSRSAEGTEPAAAAPCRHRAAVSIATVVADAPITAPTANVNNPARITRRWP